MPDIPDLLAAKASRRDLRPGIASDLLAAALPVLLPLGVMVAQAMIWESIAPFGWLGFLPAVGICAWLCGLRGALLATALSIAGAEWLLTIASGHPGVPIEAEIYSVLLFSGLAVALSVLMDRVRRDSERLHRAVAALRAAALGVSDVATPPSWRAWRRRIPADLIVIESVRHELEWRKRMLRVLQVPLATFAPDGHCLFANPAFLAALGRTGELPPDWNLSRRSDFPGTNLADAMERLMRSGDGRLVEPASLGVAGDAELHWIVAGRSGVIVCTMPPADSPLRGPADAARAQPRTSAGSSLVEGPVASPAVPAAAPASGSAALPASAPLAEPPAVPASSLAGMQCLVVDDQELNRELLREILRLEGARSVCCSSGREAIAAVRADPAAYQVVLMDLQMPGMDGYAAAQGIRQLVDASRLPIFAITADGPGIPTARLQAAGMQGVLHKPLDIERLMALLTWSATASV
jgi:CheY-like chemotaxis protein